MFTFVLYDIKNKVLLIGRDRYGITSLYYNDTDSIISTSSELKTLLHLSNNNNIKQFPPGHLYMYSYKDNKSSMQQYYNVNWKQLTYYPTMKINYLELKNILINSVLRHIQLSDVPVGALLSGGLDSSLVVSIFKYLKDKNLIKNPLRTFTIGFKDSADIQAADIASKFLGTYHTSYTFTKEEGLDALNDIIFYLETYDITTIRASIPMYLLTKKIRNETNIKVLLSGEGADEIFGGYLYFHKAPNANEFQDELRDKINNLYKYDCLRAHKACMANTIEIRPPFLDNEVVDYVMNIDSKYKMVTTDHNIEKYILRKAFDDSTFLPDEILWRQKDQFSDAVSSTTENWIDTLKNYTESQISDYEFENRATTYPVNTPLTKEHYLYRKIFEDYFPDDSCIKTVDHNIHSIACSTERGLKWVNINKENKLNDASGRSLTDIYSGNK
jgi:asparagine synthase (glutamine-hydrolysing)